MRSIYKSALSQGEEQVLFPDLTCSTALALPPFLRKLPLSVTIDSNFQPRRRSSCLRGRFYHHCSIAGRHGQARRPKSTGKVHAPPLPVRLLATKPFHIVQRVCLAIFIKRFVETASGLRFLPGFTNHKLWRRKGGGAAQHSAKRVA